jgi:uncharacterized protein
VVRLGGEGKLAYCPFFKYQRQATMNLSDPLQKPLSVEEFGKLESFLFSELMPEESFSSIEIVDGYMTALVVGPEVVSSEVWIPFIWNQDKLDEPRFSSEEEGKMVGEYLVRHMNALVAQFLDDADGFVPLFEKSRYPDKEEKELAVENWALGFTMGIELVHESWNPLFKDEETGMLVMPMLILSKVTDDIEHLSKREISEMVQLMPDFVVKIYEYWKQGKAQPIF